MEMQDTYMIINNELPDKFPGKLIHNTYLHTDDSTTILDDINDIEIYIERLQKS